MREPISHILKYLRIALYSSRQVAPFSYATVRVINSQVRRTQEKYATSGDENRVQNFGLGTMPGGG